MGRPYPKSASLVLFLVLTPEVRGLPRPTFNAEVRGLPQPTFNAAAAEALAAQPSKPEPPSYPLQAWMKANTEQAMVASDLPVLAASLDQVVGFAPKEKGYANWASIARDGATAARAGNLDGVKAACRACHTQYRASYRKELRTRPLP